MQSKEEIEAKILGDKPQPEEEDPELEELTPREKSQKEFNDRTSKLTKVEGTTDDVFIEEIE